MTKKKLLIGYLTHKKKLLVGLLILSTILGFSRAYGTTFIRPITDTIAGNTDGNLIILITLSCLYQTIFYISRFFVTFLGGKIDQGFALFIRQKLFEHINKIPYKEFEKQGCGDLQALIRSDSQNASKMLFILFSRVIMNSAVIIFSAAYMFSIDLLSTTIFLITCLTVGFMNYLLSQKAKNYEYDARKSFGDLTQQITQGTSIFDTVRLYGATPFMTSRFKDKRAEYNDQLLKKARVWSTDGVMRTLINNSTLFACAIILGYRALNGESSIGDVLLFISLLFQVSGAFTVIFTWMPIMATARAALDRVLDILKIKNDDEFIPNNPIDESVLSYENINFNFDNGPNIIENMNLHFRKGKCYRILGESGKGKTTLLKIMLGLYRPLGMTINGGTDRPPMGYVPSEPGIFNVTLFENIALGEESISQEICNKAAQKLGADIWIESLTDGWDHMIEESGSNLSGGQKRIIALMRILVRDYPVVILDEPFSDLDKEREDDLNVVLNDLKHNKIVIFTSHREDVGQIADEVIVL